MKNKLGFVGDSHTCGYFSTSDSALTWQENNYAEIYSSLNELACISYASAGAPFTKYAQWAKILLNNHPDIGKLFIQSTYWDRWSMVTNLHCEFVEMPLDLLTKVGKQKDRFTGYTDYNTVFNGITEWFEKPGFFTLENPSFHRYNPNDIQDLNDMTQDQYKKIKFWHEQLSHLTYFAYLKELKCIDAILQEFDIDGFVWFMNDDVERPKSFNAFGQFNKLHIVEYPACDFLKDTKNIDPLNFMIDEEHFNTEFHTYLAKDFIPFVLSFDNDPNTIYNRNNNRHPRL